MCYFCIMILRNSSFLLDVKTIARSHGRNQLCISEIFASDLLAVSWIGFYRKDIKLKIAIIGRLSDGLILSFPIRSRWSRNFLKEDTYKIHVCYLVNGWWKRIIDNLRHFQSFNAYHKPLISREMALRDANMTLFCQKNYWTFWIHVDIYVVRVFAQDFYTARFFLFTKMF